MVISSFISNAFLLSFCDLFRTFGMGCDWCSHPVSCSNAKSKLLSQSFLANKFTLIAIALIDIQQNTLAPLFLACVIRSKNHSFLIRFCSSNMVEHLSLNIYHEMCFIPSFVQFLFVRPNLFATTKTILWRQWTSCFFFLSLCSLRSTDVKNICSKEKVRQKANAILLLVTIPHFSFGRFYRSVEILGGFIRVILTLHTTNGSHPLFILVEKLFYWDLLGKKKKKKRVSAMIRHHSARRNAQGNCHDGKNAIYHRNKISVFKFPSAQKYLCQKLNVMSR